MRAINYLALISVLSGCSTFNKTMLYSSLGGAIAGGFIGKSASPDKESDNFNMGLGVVVGGAISAGAAYLLFREARPDLKLKNSPLREEIQLQPIKDTTLSLGALRIAPPMEPISEKKVIEFSNSVPSEIQKSAKRQYYRRHKTKPVTIEENSRTYEIPSFEVIENGVVQ